VGATGIKIEKQAFPSLPGQIKENQETATTIPNTRLIPNRMLYQFSDYAILE
jgi:hypothetical protein